MHIDIMSMTALDTHQVVKRLRSVGFTDDQAEAVTAVLVEAHDASLADVATKADLRHLEDRLDARLGALSSA